MFAIDLLIVKYMFFKIIGLAPFTFEDVEKLDDGNLKTIKMKHSQFGNLYNSVLIILIFILGAFVLKQLLHNDLPHTTKIIDIIYIIKAVVGVVVLLSLWIIMILYQSKAVKLINTIIENNKMINDNRNLSGVFSLSQFEYRITILNIINSCIWFGTLVTYPFAYEISLSLSIIVYLPAFISCCLLMQYVIMVKLQKKKFFSLHTAFVKLTRIGFSDERIITRIIIDLRRIYEMFYSTTEEIARYYSLPVFLIIINSCGKIFFLTYNILHPLIYENSPYKHVKSVTKIHLVFNLIMEGFPIVVLTYEVTCLTTEIKEIASAVLKVINESLHVNNGWLIELEEFSRRLHRMDVKLTACDFFRLDLTLLHSIISILVTYLVILLQVKDE